MENSKEFGAKQAVQTLMFYYLSSLIGKVDDPKQVIASELGAMIGLSENQIQYVHMGIKNNEVIENFNSCIRLLDTMKDRDSFDLDSVKIIKSILTIMKQECETALKDFTTFED